MTHDLAPVRRALDTRDAADQDLTRLILAARADGYTLQQIADVLGWTRAAVHYRCR
ncbi:hypothetical protein [Tomitella gaofuii]|uniref:hypothetical protein n=1 Tax=Tomitella gaofuii TaxID=2760083 RepID=UPI0015FB901C|nr:hypothetical protein [Tomitella gaofuii]